MKGSRSECELRWKKVQIGWMKYGRDRFAFNSLKESSHSISINTKLFSCIWLFFILSGLNSLFCQLVFHCYAAALLSASGSSWASLTSSPIDYSSSSIFFDISSMRPTILPFIWPNLVCIWSSICVTRLVSSCALSTLSDYCGLPCACASIYCCVFAINF